jgi:RTX calcium-binding nonapeptide repeat (4 copies)
MATFGHKRVVGPLLLLVALAVPCVALAATIDVEGTRGDDLLVIRVQPQDGARVTLNGAQAAIAASGDTIEATTGAGDDTMIFDEVEDFDPVIGLRASLGGGHDTAVIAGVGGSSAQSSGANWSIDLGSGHDTLGLHNYGDVLRLRITGGNGDDRIRMSNQSASRASGAEVFTGGGAGNDYIDLYNIERVRSDGGSGNDVLRASGPGAATLRGGAGNDRITAIRGGRDTIRCGAGADTVIADAADSVGGDCESVRRGR